MTLRDLIAEARGLDLRASPEQEATTRGRLLPRIDELLALLAVHRAAVDAEFFKKRAAQAPVADDAAPLGEARLASYPVGFCSEIRDAVWRRLPADPAFRALCGPEVAARRVFVLLRGRYFQNALQIGNLYVDVANDTVFPDKPKLEWARIEEVEFENADDWTRVAAVGRRYYGVELYPNLLFPLAFPVAPFFAVRSNGRVDLFHAQSVVFLKDLGDGLRRARALARSFAASGAGLPEPFERKIREACGGNLREAFPLEFAPTPAAELEARVFGEFDALAASTDGEAAARTADAYLRLVSQAARRLAALDLRPEPAELETWREGLARTTGT